MEKCLVIHGHFYQPPRENAWTESIERQDSAQPYHDWNDRIHAECYRTNAFSRILDHSNRIINIVNNYAQISFNFGPTLLSWLERYHPVTYGRIIEADKLSVERHQGHGNAMAQAYNHAILPLCNAGDKVTQVRWGMADFRYRFGREPEAMWLPETAVNDPTLRVLFDHGMKFVVLSPHQAKRVRSFSIAEIAPGANQHETEAAGHQQRADEPSASSIQPSASSTGVASQTFHAGAWTGVEHGRLTPRRLIVGSTRMRKAGRFWIATSTYFSITAGFRAASASSIWRATREILHNALTIVSAATAAPGRNWFRLPPTAKPTAITSAMGIWGWRIC
jgi:hypothetical protein